MKKSLKPTLALIVFAMVIPELFTASTPFIRFFNPITFIFLFLGYGIAVLIVREIAVRWKLGVGGIFKLGMAYAVFNEGLLAKTFTLQSSLPIPWFDNYGYIFGVSFPFTITISMWHALASVLLPISFIYFFYPNNQEGPWLGKKLTVILGIILLMFGLLNFFGEVRGHGTISQLIVLAILAAVFVVFAKKRPGVAFALQPILSPNQRALWFGFSILFFFDILLFQTARIKIPILLYFGILVIGTWFYVWMLKKHSWLSSHSLLLFGIGFYLSTILIGVILSVAFTNSPAVVLATGIISTITLIIFARRLIRQHQTITVGL